MTSELTGRYEQVDHWRSWILALFAMAIADSGFLRRCHASTIEPRVPTSWMSKSASEIRAGVAGVGKDLFEFHIQNTFPDWQERVLDVYGTADKVASRYVSTGTHRGTCSPHGHCCRIAAEDPCVAPTLKTLLSRAAPVPRGRVSFFD